MASKTTPDIPSLICKCVHVYVCVNERGKCESEWVRSCQFPKAKRKGENNSPKNLPEQSSASRSYEIPSIPSKAIKQLGGCGEKEYE